MTHLAALGSISDFTFDHGFANAPGLRLVKSAIIFPDPPPPGLFRPPRVADVVAAHGRRLSVSLETAPSSQDGSGFRQSRIHGRDRPTACASQYRRMIMKRLLTFLASLAVLASLVIAIPAQGAITTFITSNGDIDMKRPQCSEPRVAAVNRHDAAWPTWRLFMNQIDGAGPFAVGSHINTIGEMQVLTAIDGTSSPALLPDGGSGRSFRCAGHHCLQQRRRSGCGFQHGRAVLTSSTTEIRRRFSI